MDNQAYYPIIIEDKLYLRGRLQVLENRLKDINQLLKYSYIDSIISYSREKRHIQKEIMEVKLKLQEYYLI